MEYELYAIRLIFNHILPSSEINLILGYHVFYYLAIEGTWDTTIH